MESGDGAPDPTHSRRSEAAGAPNFPHGSTMGQRMVYRQPLRIFSSISGFGLWNRRQSAPPDELGERGDLIRALEDAKRDKKELQEAFNRKREKYIDLHGKFLEVRRLADASSHELRYSRERWSAQERQLQQSVHETRLNLEKEKEKVKSLRLKAAEYEQKLSKVYSSAVSTLAQDVSRSMPDDVAASAINTFFQGDFFSWCADMCADKINIDESAMRRLNFHGLVNESQGYGAVLSHLKFNFNLPHGMSALVLLQAALSKILVDKFMIHAYFLAPRLECFTDLEQYMHDAGKHTEAIEWRIKTVEILEAACPFRATEATYSATEFVKEFRVLLKDVDKPALQDLADIFTKFSAIALQLWKIPTCIYVNRMPELEARPFEKNCKWADCEAATLAQLGDEVNNRPIGNVMRPGIVSVPIVKHGEHGETFNSQKSVVWSKALVWVSGEKDPYDFEAYAV